MAFPTGWNRKAKLTIQNGKVPSNLVNFPTPLTEANLPVAVNELFDADGSHPGINGGGDLRVSSDEAGSTQLSLEVVSFVTNNNPAVGTAELWVKIPSVASATDTVIWLWWEKSGETQPAVDAAFGRNSVWPDYEIVMHLSDGITDATGNHTATDTGTAAATGAFGLSNTARRGDSTGNDKIVIAGLTTINEPFTIQAWGFIELNDNSRIVCVGDASETDQQVNLRTDFTESLGASFIAQAGTSDIIDTANHQGQNTWRLYHGVLTADDDRELFVNGGSEGTSSVSKTITGLDAFALFVTADLTPFGEQPLRVDEARLRLSALSADWITAEHNSQSSPATFIIDSTPEAAVPGGARPQGPFGHPFHGPFAGPIS